MKNTLMELVDKCEPFQYFYDKDTEELFLKAEELKELGFKEVSQELYDKVNKNQKLKEISNLNYLVITPKKIETYLKSKVARYNEEHKQKQKEEILSSNSLFINSDSYRLTYNPVMDNIINFPELVESFVGVISTDIKNDKKQKEEKISEKTCDYYKINKNTIGQFIWTETPIRKYKQLPPANVLEIMKEHVRRNVFDYFTIASVSHIVDPILLGRVYDCEDRFFIPGCQWGEDIQIDDLL